MRCFVIDPFTKRIMATEFRGNISEIYELIGNRCDCFTAVGLWEAKDAVFVDDEGLFRRGLRSFGLDGYPVPLFGRGVVLGADDEGEPTAPKITLPELQKRVSWLIYVTTGSR